jgi:hypothetical protein
MITVCLFKPPESPFPVPRLIMGQGKKTRIFSSGSPVFFFTCRKGAKTFLLSPAKTSGDAQIGKSQAVPAVFK